MTYRAGDGWWVMRRTLGPDDLLRVQLDAMISNAQFTRDPGGVIAELRRIAGDRTDLLAESVGIWVGAAPFGLGFEYQRVLWEALSEMDGIDVWVEVGRERGSRPAYTSRRFDRN